MGGENGAERGREGGREMCCVQEQMVNKTLSEGGRCGLRVCPTMDTIRCLNYSQPLSSHVNLLIFTSLTTGEAAPDDHVTLRKALETSLENSFPRWKKYIYTELSRTSPETRQS